MSLGGRQGGVDSGLGPYPPWVCSTRGTSFADMEMSPSNDVQLPGFASLSNCSPSSVCRTQHYEAADRLKAVGDNQDAHYRHAFALPGA